MRDTCPIFGFSSHVLTKHLQFISHIDVTDYLQYSDWMTGIDMQQVYFHLPIVECRRLFLYIIYNGEILQLSAPFDVPSAPLAFSTVSNIAVCFTKKKIRNTYDCFFITTKQLL